MPPLSKWQRLEQKEKSGPASYKEKQQSKNAGKCHDEQPTNIEEYFKPEKIFDLKLLDRNQLLFSLNKILESVENSNKNLQTTSSRNDKASKKRYAENTKKKPALKIATGPASRMSFQNENDSKKKPGPASRTQIDKSKAQTITNAKGNFEVYRAQYETRRKKGSSRKASTVTPYSQNCDNDTTEPSYYRVFSENPVYRSSTRLSEIIGDELLEIQSINTSGSLNKDVQSSNKSHKNSDKNIEPHNGTKKGKLLKRNTKDSIVDLTLMENEDLKVGDKVMAVWKMNQKYPAKIIDIEHNEAYLVEFYDGVLWKVKPNKIWKMKRDEEEKYKDEFSHTISNASSGDENSSTSKVDEISVRSTISSKRKTLSLENPQNGKFSRNDTSSDENDDKDGLVWKTRPNHIFNPRPGPASAKKLKLTISKTIKFQNQIENGIVPSSNKLSSMLFGPKSRMNRPWKRDLEPLNNDNDDYLNFNPSFVNQDSFMKDWKNWAFSTIWESTNEMHNIPCKFSSKRHIPGETFREELAICSNNAAKVKNGENEVKEHPTLHSHCSGLKEEEFYQWKDFGFNIIWNNGHSILKNISSYELKDGTDNKYDNHPNKQSRVDVLHETINIASRYPYSDKKDSMKFHDIGQKISSICENECAEGTNIETNFKEFRELKNFIYEYVWGGEKHIQDVSM